MENQKTLLIKEIAKLQKQYDNSTDRKAYTIGKRLREKQQLLKTLEN